MPLTLIPQAGHARPATIGLRGTRIVIGRSAEADLRLDHPSIKDEHAVARPDGDGWVLEATGPCSSGSVQIPTGQPRLLQHGVAIRIGDVDVECTDLDTVEARRTVDLAVGALKRAMQTSAPIDQWSARVLQGSDRGLLTSLPPNTTTPIGRTKGAGVVLSDPKVSREHAVLRIADGAVQVRDMGAAQGTFLGPQRLEPGRWAIWKKSLALRVGDTVLACVPPTIDAIEAHIDAASTPPPAPPPEPAESAPAAVADVKEEPKPEPKPEPEAQPTKPSEEPAPIQTEARATAGIVGVAVTPKKKAANLGFLVYAAAGLVLVFCLFVIVWIFRG
jgi:pSer/pThr/pTyr-binding forkhead associated (FHA) protein